MLIWRGFGILAPIIFAAVYAALYWICKIIASPHAFDGWFVYFGAFVAGVATWKIGSAFNREIYAAKRMYPNQDIYSHSLFFIPMEFWAIPFLIVAMFVGQKNTNKIKRAEAYQQKRIEKAISDFDLEVKLQDSLIQFPKYGDYYFLQYKGSYKSRGKTKTTNYYLPYKVTDFTDTQIQLYCPYASTPENGMFLKQKKDMLEDFKNGKDGGAYFWVKKDALTKGIKRDRDNRNVDLTYIQGLANDASFSIGTLWRIDGPVFEKYSGFWKAPRLNLVIRNRGLSADIYAIQYKGNKVSWKKYKPTGSVRQNGIDYEEDSIVRIDQRFHISGNMINSDSPHHIEVFCHDSEGRKFRFDIRKKEEQITIERVEIIGHEKDISN